MLRDRRLVPVLAQREQTARVSVDRQRRVRRLGRRHERAEHEERQALAHHRSVVVLALDVHVAVAAELSVTVERVELDPDRHLLVAGEARALARGPHADVIDNHAVVRDRGVPPLVAARVADDRLPIVRAHRQRQFVDAPLVVQRNRRRRPLAEVAASARPPTADRRRAAAATTAAAGARSAHQRQRDRQRAQHSPHELLPATQHHPTPPPSAITSQQFGCRPVARADAVSCFGSVRSVPETNAETVTIARRRSRSPTESTPWSR